MEGVGLVLLTHLISRRKRQLAQECKCPSDPEAVARICHFVDSPLEPTDLPLQAPANEVFPLLQWQTLLQPAHEHKRRGYAIC